MFADEKTPTACRFTCCPTEVLGCCVKKTKNDKHKLKVKKCLNIE